MFPSTIFLKSERMAGGLLVSLALLCLLHRGGGSRMLDDDYIDSCDLSPILVPKLYELKFDLEFSKRTFNGEVVITGNVLRITNNIILDSAVNVTKSTLYYDNELHSPVESNQNNSVLDIKFKYPLYPDSEYKLIINFEGEIRMLRGIFGTNYSSPNSDSYFVATEFQPNYASHAFPCIDRPKYKAQFLLNVSREAHHVALSNMPLDSSHPDIHDENKMWDSFKKTPPMSTYTFAFVVGDFVPVSSADCNSAGSSVPVRPDNCNTVDSEGDPVRPEDCNAVDSEGDSAPDPQDDRSSVKSVNTIWVIRGHERLGCLPMKWAPKYMEWMENYTGIPFELPKLDHVALPLLASTAMEHWGLITYKQEALLIDENDCTIRSKFGLIWIMAHEIAHQWFGNLVTCSSWVYTWLNEGITSFLHFLISGKVFPEWDMLGLMMSEDVLKVMDDEGFSAVSLTKDNCIMEASETFSMASYYKGAALMRIAYFLLGENALQTGLRNYLNENNHNSVTQEDLWMHFEKHASLEHLLPYNKTLTTVMQSWSNNYGFPLITVTRNETIMLEQVRLVFFLPDDLPDQQWWVPLSYTTSSERNFSKTVPRVWMDPNSKVTILNEHVRQDDWIIFNIEQSGYYRVLYDNLTWDLLSKQLLNNFTTIPPLTRAKLLDDAFTLAFYKKLPYSTPLTLARYLEKETHYYPWVAAIRALEHIHFYLRTTEVNDRYEKFIMMLLEKVYSNLLVDRKDTNAALLYTKVLNFACNLGHKGCEEKAKEMMDRLLSGDTEYARSHKDEIYPLMCTMVRLGGQDIWDLAFEMYVGEKVFKPKDELMDALKCTKDKEVIKKFTKKHLDGEKYYVSIDLFTSDLPDKNCYCTVIEVIDTELSDYPERIEDLTSSISDLANVNMPGVCSAKLRALVEKYIDDREDILMSIEKSKKPWIRLKEFEEWFDEETNRLEGKPYGVKEDDEVDMPSFPHRRQLFDGMEQEGIDLSYPHHRSHDYDYETRHGHASQVNSSASTEFSLYILLFSVLPSPLYLTYLFFAPFL